MFPHAPQLDEDVKMFISHPFAVNPSQFKNPVSQLEIVHDPPEHPEIALGKVHTTPHPPQFTGDVFSFVSQPSALIPLQSLKPALQKEMTHTPPVHADTAFAKLHTIPHDPQFITDELMFVSHPSESIALQSAKPLAQLIMVTLSEFEPHKFVMVHDKV